MARWKMPPAVALSILILGMCTFGVVRLHSIEDGINTVLTESRITQGRIMQSLESTVTNAGGLEIKVVTPRDGTETDAAHVARHLSLCQTAKDS